MKDSPNIIAMNARYQENGRYRGRSFSPRKKGDYSPLEGEEGKITTGVSPLIKIHGQCLDPDIGISK